MALSPELQKLFKDTRNKLSRSTTRTYQIKEGKTRIRILQDPTKPKFWAELGVHWVKTETGGKPVAVVGCHDITYEAECPVCAAIEKGIHGAVDDDTLKLFKEMKSRKRILVNALIRSGADASPDPVIVELTPTTFTSILSIADEYGEDIGNIFDAVAGIDLTIERKGKGFDTEYNVIPAPKSDSVDPKVVARMHDLDEFIKGEYFRGEESKAIRAVNQLAGVSGLSLVGSASSAGLLTSAGTVEDLDLEAMDPLGAASKPAPAETPKAADPAPEDKSPAEAASTGEIDTSELDALLSDLEGLTD